MWHFGEGMSWWMVFGGIWMIAFWGGLIALIVWGVKKITERNAPPSRQDPLEIAKERYARGEITSEEFQKIKKDLSS